MRCVASANTGLHPNISPVFGSDFSAALVGWSTTASSGVRPTCSNRPPSTAPGFQYAGCRPQAPDVARDIQTAAEELHPLEPAVAAPAHPDLPEIVLGEVAWPLIGQATIDAEPQNAWRFEQILGDNHMGDPRESVILHLSAETLFAWCHAHPESAPTQLAVLASRTMITQRVGCPTGLWRRAITGLLTKQHRCCSITCQCKRNSHLHHHAWSAVGLLASAWVVEFSGLDSDPQPVLQRRQWASRVWIQRARRIVGSVKVDGSHSVPVGHVSVKKPRGGIGFVSAGEIVEDQPQAVVVIDCGQAERLTLDSQRNRSRCCVGSGGHRGCWAVPRCAVFRVERSARKPGTTRPLGTNAAS